eukprot:m.69450 g.69450  ORF g.69450 m.69450 type:complete len:374 (-) comp11629_c0_seq1:72-1193(-)
METSSVKIFDVQTSAVTSVRSFLNDNTTDEEERRVVVSLVQGDVVKEEEEGSFSEELALDPHAALSSFLQKRAPQPSETENNVLFAMFDASATSYDDVEGAATESQCVFPRNVEGVENAKDQIGHLKSGLEHDVSFERDAIASTKHIVNTIQTTASAVHSLSKLTKALISRLGMLKSTYKNRVSDASVATSIHFAKQPLEGALEVIPLLIEEGENLLNGSTDINKFVKETQEDLDSMCEIFGKDEEALNFLVDVNDQNNFDEETAQKCKQIVPDSSAEEFQMHMENVTQNLLEIRNVEHTKSMVEWVLKVRSEKEKWLLLTKIPENLEMSNVNETSAAEEEEEEGEEEEVDVDVAEYFMSAEEYHVHVATRNK